MSRWFVVLLRAISNVPMQPFRQRMEALGFTGVESYGMSGNLLFNTDRSDKAELERLFTAQFGTLAVVRSRQELSRIVAEDPFGSSILILACAPTATKRRAFLKLDFEGPRPALHGRTVYFVNPARLYGRHTPFDFERNLDVQGTARSAGVVSKLLARLSAAESRDYRRPT